MSGIAALFLKKNDSSIIDKLNYILKYQDYRGSEGIETKVIDNFGIGLNYKRILPEDNENPVIYNKNDYYLVCDARIDNRDELISLLSLDSKISESELLLECFIKWGNDCVNHLIGDYAVIIYDKSNASIFAMRDHMGIKPLYIRQNSFGIILSSDFKSLLNPGNGFDKLDINQVKKEQILNFLNTGSNETDKILFEEIERIPPASYMIINSDFETKLQTYWRPQHLADKFPVKSPKILKEIFDEAVRCRLRSIKPVCSLISGGLDSSSIAVSAKASMGDKELTSFSVVFDKHPKLNEREYIESITKTKGYIPNFLPLDNYGPLSGLDDLIYKAGRLFFAPGQKMMSLVYEKIKSQNFGVILDGNGGDEIVSHGTRRLNELAQSQKWLSVWVNLKNTKDILRKSRLNAFVILFAKYCNLRGTYSLRKFLASKFFPKNLDSKNAQLLSEKFQEKVKSLEFKPIEVIEPENESEYHEYILNAKFTQQSIEFHEFFAAIHGLEIRLPFYDKRMVEYCLSIPSEMKFNKGFTRLIMRQAMAGVLPDKIRWRRGKLDFSQHIRDGLRANNYEELDKIIEQNIDNIGEYVNLSMLQEIYRNFKVDDAKVAPLEFMFMWRSCALSLWLRGLN